MHAHAIVGPAQSNGVGNYDLPQPWLHATLRPELFRASFPAEGWVRMREHTNDGPSGQHIGSPWPRFATLHMAARGEATRILTGGVGGTGFVNTADAPSGVAWAVGGSAYQRLISAVAAAGITSADALHMFIGENDAQQNYRSTLEDEWFAAVLATHAGLQAAFGFSVPLIVWQTGNIYGAGGAMPTTEQRSLNAIKRAEARLWDEPNIFPGPVTCDLDHRPDPLHLTSSAHAQIVAARAWHHHNVAVHGAPGGRGPRFLAAQLSAPKVIELVPTVANTGLGIGARPTRGWRVTGANGVKITPSGASLGSTLVLRLPTAPALPCTVSWGKDADATGATTLDAAGLPPEPFELAVA